MMQNKIYNHIKYRGGLANWFLLMILTLDFEQEGSLKENITHLLKNEPYLESISVLNRSYDWLNKHKEEMLEKTQEVLAINNPPFYMYGWIENYMQQIQECKDHMGFIEELIEAVQYEEESKHF